MSPLLEQSYAYCEHVAKTQARNFYYSFVTLPPARKAAMCAIYAFFRYSDDVSDEMPDVTPTGATKDGSTTIEAARVAKEASMREWRTALDRAFAGDYGDSQILPAFHDTVKKYNIPIHYFHELIDGTEMDLTTNRYETFAELHGYCYRVASIVGFVCIHVWGFDSADGKAIEYAEACGLALQLTNILRDVKEDAERDRIYLPQEDLRRYGVTDEQLKAGTLTEPIRMLLEFEAARAREFYATAQKLFPLVHPPGRPTLSIMIRIYRGILDDIVARKYDVFSDRARVSTPKKLIIVAQAWVSSRFQR